MASEIVPGQTLEAFFFDRVHTAQERRGTELSTEVEAYAVHLLAGYARRPAPSGRRTTPLALQYLEARERGVSALRDVGDRALFISGVVPQSMDRSPVGLDYVQSIGRSAYREVSDRARSLEVFIQLAEAFEALAAILGDAATPDAEDGATLLELYERWRRFGRATDAARLSAAGVVVDRGDDDLH